MRIQTVGFVVTLASLVLMGTEKSAWPLPQFGIQFGAELHGDHVHDELLMTFDCRACHVNPTGGGMRNEHGRAFSIGKLPISDATEETQKASEAAQINPSLSFGTDLRFAYLRAEEETVGTAAKYKDSFFPMQADFYLAFTPTDYMTFYYQDGVELSGSRETFILLERLPFNSHVKAGRFTPPYGLKLDDHTSFIRDKLGFGAPAFGKDAGLELGFSGHHGFGNVAAFNGGSPYGDSNHDKGVAATGGWKSARFWLAGSYYNNDNGTEKKTYYGGYGALRLWRLTFLGEWDRAELKNSDETGSVMYGEIDFSVRKGATMLVKYDRCEDDHKGICVDDVRLDRLTVGFNLYPTPFTEAILQYRKNKEDTEIRNDRILAMLHFYY